MRIWDLRIEQQFINMGSVMYSCCSKEDEYLHEEYLCEEV
jgi:hypothetical protein